MNPFDELEAAMRRAEKQERALWLLTWYLAATAPLLLLILLIVLTWPR